MTFSDYSGPIDQLSTLECILSASEDASTGIERALEDDDPLRMPVRYIRMDAEHASLIITNNDWRMKWTTCAQTLKALTVFMERWDYVGLKFVVVEDGVRVGVGILAGR